MWVYGEVASQKFSEILPGQAILYIRPDVTNDQYRVCYKFLCTFVIHTFTSTVIFNLQLTIFFYWFTSHHI